MKVAGIHPATFLNHMTKLRKFFYQFQDEGYSKWIFIIPSVILLAVFALPLVALILRSINSNFFNNAFSEQAFKALKLSLVTSSITTIIAGCIRHTAGVYIGALEDQA